MLRRILFRNAPLLRSNRISPISRFTPTRSYYVPPPPSNRNLTFDDLNLPWDVVEGLRQRFPEVVNPSPCQEALVPAILDPTRMGRPRDVILRAETGTGKSFGMMLALLAKAKARVYGSLDRPPTTLLIVPHRELAYQYKHWINTLLPEGQDLIQLCVRGDPENPIPFHLMEPEPSLLHEMHPELQKQRQAQIDSLATFQRPRILIATPPALLELLLSIPYRDVDGSVVAPPYPFPRKPSIFPTAPPLPIDRLGLNITTVAVDEIDDLLKLPTKRAGKKEQLKFHRHVPPLIPILDAIYGKRDFSEKPKRVWTPKEKPSTELPVLFSRPQLILASATLSAETRRYMIGETRWIAKKEGPHDRDTVIRLDFSVRSKSKPAMADSSSHNQDSTTAEPVPNLSSTTERLPSAITHSCIVVQEDGKSRNIGAKYKKKSYFELQEAGLLQKPKNVDFSKPFVMPKAITIPDSRLLLTMATAFALDVPSLALLALPGHYHLQETVNQLRELEIDARVLDLKERERWALAGNSVSPDDEVLLDPDLPIKISRPPKEEPETREPTLLLTTFENTRGLDLPELTHVFMLDPLPTDPIDFHHITGRVGRFGKPGKVISIVNEGQDQPHGQRRVVDPRLPKKYDGEQAARFHYKRLGVTPQPFDALL